MIYERLQRLLETWTCRDVFVGLFIVLHDRRARDDARWPRLTPKLETNLSLVITIQINRSLQGVRVRTSKRRIPSVTSAYFIVLGRWRYHFMLSFFANATKLGKELGGL